jgi:hypothetical protein
MRNVRPGHAQGSDPSVGRHLRDNIVAQALQAYVTGVAPKLDTHGAFVLKR